MISFYTKWLESGNKRTAFTEAQKIIKERYQKPSLWGAFVMVGVK
jgi:CHAT domain-containing protein